MEDDLKILKVEYLSNYWSDFPQILNLSLGEQTKITNSWKEDDLQWKMTSDYKKLNISATSTDFPQISKLSLGDQTKTKRTSKGRRPPMEDKLKILKLEYLSNHWLDLPQILNYITYEFLGGN